ncbi:MAG: hypothetical protein A2Y79_10025 [Deltaproteobacteria bacterium RBG_13_43_22]|nr:MAG: hypothetical protein A2Y79_10025 [Deltaproteobacteria bacterium RBG_13_43_22]
MSIISRILGRVEFVNEPPILLDIGASDSLPEKWKEIARFSVCVAFDADDREMNFVEKENENYQKLYVFNRIVTDREISELNFYLTKSPYCSSTLPPDPDKLKDWEFTELFRVEKTVMLKTVQLKGALADLGLKKIDWFKADTQGTDLRLFQSLGEIIINKILAAEFEPGIIDVYQGEDKLHHLMAYMDTLPFWMSDIKILGFRRINQDILQNLDASEKEALQAVRTSPNWAELIYLNSFSQRHFSKRDFLLGCIFAIIEKQYGFALELSIRGYEEFQDDDFQVIERFVLTQMISEYQKKNLDEVEMTTSPKKSLLRLVSLFQVSKQKQLKILRSVWAKNVTLTIVREPSGTRERLFLKASCKRYRQPQFRFWGRKSEREDFILLADWSPEAICPLPETYRDCRDFGVHIRSGDKGDWQNQAWVKNLWQNDV